MGYTSKKYHRSVRNVAMVCVAAVALGSSTYAWFVSNNQVTVKDQNNNPVVVSDKTSTKSVSYPHISETNYEYTENGATRNFAVTKDGLNYVKGNNATPLTDREATAFMSK